MSGFVLRPEQQRVIDEYKGGYAAISAVPGAGKTTTLSALAAHLIEDIGPRQRVVIVTYQNAAVANFQRAVTQRLEERGKPPRGFVVRTLHSLALEVLSSVRHRAELDIGARVIDEANSQRMLDEIIAEMKVRHRDTLRELLVDEAAATSRWPTGDDKLFRGIVTTALRELRTETGAGDIETLRAQRGGYGRWLPFVLDVCCAYQQELREQGYLDYDGLIVRAVSVLERDRDLRHRLRKRWPYLLEDEAQDSNPLLENMLKLIAGENGNLVRVGDANQSILTTFTASSVEGFRRWLAAGNVDQYTLSGSSRSTEAILDLANRLVERVATEFPVEEVRRTALQRQEIRPVIDPDGTRRNPESPRDASLGLQAREFKHTDMEREEVLGRALAYLRKNPDRTVGILVGSKDVGYEYAESAREMGFPDGDIIRLLGDRDGRQVGLIDKVLPIIDFLQDPEQPHWIQEALELWSASGSDDRVAASLKGIRYRTEISLAEVFYPSLDARVGAALELPEDLTAEEQQTLRRIEAVPGWLENRLARPGELLSLIAATVEIDDAERQLMDAVIATVEGVTPDTSTSRLVQLRKLLKELRDRQRRLRGSHEQHEIHIRPGTLTVSTRHQAKGLEWDVVFAVGCDDFWFKGSLDFTRRQMRGHLAPFDQQLVMMTELQFAVQGLADYPSYQDFQRTTIQQAIEEVSEGLRIMYVTITRARLALWVSWHQVGTFDGQLTTRNESPIFPLVAGLIDEIRQGASSVVAD
jgi:DNA helicase II / ATP-dependent DNA helicase PcrA